ncbi:hypothetical protein [Amedibacterium intestinale]|uniref:Protein CopB n=1 Tax=Amedibacterium intestinale TaxID=2583452 RepID=A0A6N4TJ35_9FIRM|nr:hypothetical protein [Amedibacterium intestinale]BBK22759.1 hypothetical protein Aargi30884_16620 [Amedibacterium intestinale]
MSNFNENEYKREWKKENMKVVKATFKNDFVIQFKNACKSLNITQAEVIRKAMEDTIEKAKSNGNF